MKKIAVVIIAAIFLIYTPAISQIENLEKEIDDEIKWLQEEAVVFTEIATKTKMDADLVPGMVTVLKGEDLERKGARTVGEALAMVPGLDLGGS